MGSKSIKCKGIGKCVKISGCGAMSPYLRYGLCPSCLFEWSQENESGKVWYATQFIPKVKKRTAEVKKKEKKEEKESFIDWPSKLQNKVNEIIRLIDIGMPCLARGYHPKMIHAGHIYSRGSNSSMKFNTHNIHRQSAQSNHFQNEDGLLREGLVKEYGVKYFEFLSSCRGTKDLRFYSHEYHDFYKKACKIALEYKRNGDLFTTEQRILERNKVNKSLGIYEEKYCVFI